ncbi:WD repeat-containing protein 64-like [Pelobates fuscus]|uniref:WD repeat-containing protein 64-like n=1 Tax=Pelobates fuscus TaxID=191477 RepID=UPI002FE4B027
MEVAKLEGGSSVVDVWTLTQLIQDTQQVPCTHERPIIVLVYNQIFQQLLSICSESVIKINMIEARGSSKGLVDSEAQRSLQTWDFGSGRELKAMTPVKGNKDEKQSIIHVCFHRDHENTQMIVAVNLKGTIKILQSGKDDKFLNVIMEFTVESDPLGRTPNPTLQPIGKSKKFPRIKPVVLLKSNEYSEQKAPFRNTLTCCDALAIEKSLLLATGSENGPINLYNFEEGAVQHICFMNDKMQTTMNDFQKQSVNTILFLYPRKVVTVSRVHASVVLQQDTSRIKTDANITAMASDGQPHSPVIASGHEDGHIYLWNLKGNILSDVMPVTNHPLNPLTTLCTNAQANIMLAGDNATGFLYLSSLSVMVIISALCTWCPISIENANGQKEK